MPTEHPASGVLQLNAKGFGFLRQAATNYLPSPQDVLVPRPLIQQFRLREGVHLVGAARPAEHGRGGRGLVPAAHLTGIDLINGADPAHYARVPEFSRLTSVDPTERLALAAGHPTMAMRVLDLIAPIGKGQRGLIVAPPKTGKTTLIEEIAAAVAAQHPETHLVVMLVDERPEEVTHLKRRVRGEVIASSADHQAEDHLRITHLVHERVKRLVECHQDVVLLLDSLTRLARAANRATRGRGSTLSGGVDARALAFPRQFFGAARNTEEGGSLTMLGTALVDTGSQMDEVIFQEFKGTGNLEIVLDRHLADRRLFPAIDIAQSGTRKEEKLFDAATLPHIHVLRRALAGKQPLEAMALLRKGLSESRDNHEFLARVKRTVGEQQ